MAIVKAPLKTDPRGKCSRWRVIVYNPDTAKHEWHTVRGTRKDAESFERQSKEKLARGTYISRTSRKTFAEVAKLFLQNCVDRNRRTSTRLNYKSVLECHLLPTFGSKEIGSIRRNDCATFFSDMRTKGASIELINRCIRVMKTLLFFAVERELVERNVMQRFKPFGGSKRQAKRGAYTEAEVQALFAAARANERALIGMLCLTGIRPGEAYALREMDVDLEAGAAHIARNWDWRGKQFTEPKTDAGKRTVALSGWLVEELRAYLSTRERDPEALLFASRTGGPLNPSNVRRDIWLKLVKRAGVPARDLYSLRHTFVSLGRVSGEAAFNVARAMGHSRSTLVDEVYAHSLPSGMASVAERVTARVFGEQPKLRVIDGKAPEKSPDVRHPLDDRSKKAKKNAASA